MEPAKTSTQQKVNMMSAAMKQRRIQALNYARRNPKQMKVALIGFVGLIIILIIYIIVSSIKKDWNIFKSEWWTGGFTKKCTEAELTTLNAKTGTMKDSNCVVSNCLTGYTLTGGVCVLNTENCTEAKLTTLNAKTGTMKDSDCVVSECLTGYNLTGGVCMLNTENCAEAELTTLNAKTGTMEDSVCVVSECLTDYTLTDGVCVLNREECNDTTDFVSLINIPDQGDDLTGLTQVSNLITFSDIFNPTKATDNTDGELFSLKMNEYFEISDKSIIDPGAGNGGACIVGIYLKPDKLVFYRRNRDGTFFQNLEEKSIDASIVSDNISFNINRRNGVTWLGSNDGADSNVLWKFESDGSQPAETSRWRLDSDNNCPYIFIRPATSNPQGAFTRNADGNIDGTVKFSIIGKSACS